MSVTENDARLERIGGFLLVILSGMGDFKWRTKFEMSCLFGFGDTIRVIYCQEKEARWVEFFFFPIHVDLNNKNYCQI